MKVVSMACPKLGQVAAATKFTTLCSVYILSRPKEGCYN